MSKFILKDSFYKKAKQEGYRARSVYKLKEISDKFGLIKRGDTVLDLGCAPGSFLQILSGMVGAKGTVIGIDILPIPALPATNVTTYQADIREADIKDLLSGHSAGAFDAVTCDIAPNLSGIREVDDARIEELYSCVIKIVEEGLKSGGNFIVKSFFTSVQRGITADLKKRFRRVSLYKPAASRSISSELYFICTGKN